MNMMMPILGSFFRDWFPFTSSLYDWAADGVRDACAGLMDSMGEQLGAFAIWLWGMVMSWVQWLFDPIHWMSWALELLGAIFNFAALLMPDDIASKLRNVGEFVQGVPIQKAAAVALYLVSPVVTPSFLLLTFTAILFVWTATLVLRIGIWLSSLLWTNPG